MKPRTLFSAFFLTTMGCLIVLGIIVYMMLQNQFIQEQIDHKRYESYIIADELRQSSDDLTRYCRTYVLTGDSTWENKYREVLDIRNGKKTRPDGRTIPLKEIIKQLGFTETELEKLKLAEDNSNELVHTERVAFNAMKGLFEDANGNFTIKGAPDPKLAQTIMFNEKYHADKAKIMNPIDEFSFLLNQRMEKTSKELISKGYSLLSIIIGLIVIISGITLFSFIKKLFDAT